MNGKFNFGFIEKEDLYMKHTFENRYYPSTFLLIDGKSYKYADSLTGERLERFILNKDRYTEARIQFDIPSSVINDIVMYVY